MRKRETEKSERDRKRDREKEKSERDRKRDREKEKREVEKKERHRHTQSWRGKTTLHFLDDETLYGVNKKLL